MVRLTEKFSCVDAARCSVVVMNGGLGFVEVSFAS